MNVCSLNFKKICRQEYRRKFSDMLEIRSIKVTLNFFSGIPLLEKKSDERHKSKEDYLDYKKKTSPLIPFPTSLFVKLPSFIKCVFCFEWPIYNYLENNDETVPIRSDQTTPTSNTIVTQP